MSPALRTASRAVLLLLLAGVLSGSSCTWAWCSGDDCDNHDDDNNNSTALEIATFGGWELGPVLSPLPGVVSVRSGWNGGNLPFLGPALAPYTGHQRATEVRFDPACISYAELVRAVRSARADSLRMTVFAHSPLQSQAAAREFPADSLPRVRLRHAGNFTPR